MHKKSLCSNLKQFPTLLIYVVLKLNELIMLPCISKTQLFFFRKVCAACHQCFNFFRKVCAAFHQCFNDGNTGSSEEFSAETETDFCMIFSSHCINSFLLVSEKLPRELTSGANSKLFGNTLFVTEVLVFIVSMLIQHK